MELRQITFKVNNEELEGFFHQWGIELFQTHESNHTYSVGICEDIMGNIYMVYPTEIKFKR